MYVYLSRNPEALASLRKELDEVFGPNSEPEFVAGQILANPKLLNQLDYTLAVARETLRLEPPAQMIRSPAGPYHVSTRSGQSYFLEEGTMIFINTYQMARNIRAWGEDAAEFKPERFMNGNIPTAYMTFSKRPRDCIGTNFAYLEIYLLFYLVDEQMRIILALTSRKFDIVLAKDDIQRVLKLTVNPLLQFIWILMKKNIPSEQCPVYVRFSQR